MIVKAGGSQNPRLGHTRMERRSGAFERRLHRMARKNIRHRLNSVPVNQELRTV